MTGPRPSVLLLTQDFDPTVDPVVHALRERDAEVIRIDLSYFPQRMSLTATDFGGDGGSAGTRRILRHRGREADLDALTGVWYRRPTGFAFDDRMGEAELQFARNEAMLGVGGILRSTDCLWMNRPDLDSVAELKPYQLALATRLGIRVPRTLITNDPDEVSALLRDSHGPVVYKALTGGVFHYPGAFPSGLLTSVVGAEITEHLSRVTHTMCQFQEYVEKDHEVRLTVIGNTYVPVRIRSQDSETTSVDWRGNTGPMLYGDYEPIPEDLVKRVQLLLEELGIVYAAVDFIVTPEGEYVFLECNPNGQFMWMQHELGIRFDQLVADTLTAGGRFTRGEVTQVGY